MIHGAIRHIYFTTTFIFAFLPLPVVTVIVALPAFLAVSLPVFLLTATTFGLEDVKDLRSVQPFGFILTVACAVVFFFMVISSRGGAWPRSIELESPFRAVPEPGRQPKTRPATANTATGRVDKSYCLPFLASGLYRWPRSLTGSALFGSGRGLYRQWGIAPRPETNFLGRV